MISQITAAIHRTRNTLLVDSVGAAALVVMLLAALHLPGLA